MNKIAMMLTASLVLVVGCVQPDDKLGTPFCEDGCELPPNNQTPNNQTPNNQSPSNNVTAPPELPSLKGLFISGHLGTYWECPDEAYDPDGDANAGADAGFCDGEGCFSSCETAQVTLSLGNGGSVAAQNILVDRIELFGMDGISRAELPLNAVIDTSTNEPFDGHLDAGEEIVLRIEFQGPYNSWELLQPIEDGESSGDRASGTGGIIETTFSSDNHADLIVPSGEIYDVGSIAT